jgi:asparagine synthase (glutamine-hydrolysing)
MAHTNEEEKHFDERQKTEIMARAFQTEHYEMVLQYSDIGRAVPMVCWHNEEPRVGQTYTNYYISRLAAKFVKVALSGTGGDELFGGYPWRYYRGLAARNFEDYIDSYYTFWQRLIPTSAINQVFGPISANIHVDPKETFRHVFQNHDNPLRKPEDYINHSLYFEAKVFLSGMLMIEDKLTMAHGLESRVPMLDNDLVEFAQRLPVKYKLSDIAETLQRMQGGTDYQGQYIRTNLGKQLLRKTMEKYIPHEIDRADKQGFSAPDASWFREECRYLVDGAVYNNNARIWELFDKAPIRSLVDEHMEGKANRRLLIWSLINFNQFLSTWF